MAFFLNINNDQMHFGGQHTIVEDWVYLSQSRSVTHVNDNGVISTPIGIWVLGSCVMATVTASKLRMMRVMRDQDLIELSGMNRVIILLVTEENFYIYRKYARGYRPIKDGQLRWELECPPGTVDAAISKGKLSKYWDVVNTYIERY